jgi:tetraacyldisaccharide 4'-kinase
MSGEARGARAAALRTALALGELPYALVARARNAAFDVGLRGAARLPRPVISVGNITAGGTGKTPVVRWLAGQLRAGGRTVAVLSRGYKAAPGTLGDEQRMLADLLASEPGTPPVIIRAHPSRAAAGQAVLREHPGVQAFVLDDGFQHRQLARDFDLVLVNAAEPFGYGRVIPRGLLREPLAGLRRAGAFLLTRVDQAGPDRLAVIRDVLRRHNPGAPVYESVHAPTGFRAPDVGGVGGDSAGRPVLPLDALRDRRWFAFCGIAGPGSFVRQVERIGGTNAGHRAFPDHHPYSNADLRRVRAEAAAAGADVLVTTEKDWVKLAALPAATDVTAPPIWRLDVQIQFNEGGEAALLSTVSAAVDQWTAKS